ncbi:MAG: DUF167 domain-containing protein [Acidobacteria bacterium]|nr:DUF167 domain-containing protein [Acidobacteriota bacterium]
MIDTKVKQGGVEFKVRVVPRASKTEIVGVIDGALKIRLKAPPVDGAANEELIRFLAKVLDIPRRSLSITSGEHSRLKTVLAVETPVETIQALPGEA